MQLKKEVHFNYEGQDYFVSMPLVKETFHPSQFREVLDLLESNGVQRLYDVEEDIKGRYLTVLVNKSLSFLEGSQELPKGVELRAGKDEPYLYLPEGPLIFSYCPEWLAVVDEKWKQA